MIKIFLDTHIILDLLSKREPFFEETEILFKLAEEKEIELSISELSFANTNYILTQQISLEETKEILKILKSLVTIIPINDKIIDMFLNNNDFIDYDSGIQYYTAQTTAQKAIITRNSEHFKNSEIAIMSTKEFINLFNS